MAKATVKVEFDPNTKKVEAALARIQSQAKGVNFGSGAQSLDKLSRPLGKITGQANEFQKSLEASNARVLAFGASVAVINKLSQAFGALVSNTIKVEATFAKINTILGGTEKQLSQFGRGIFQVAKNTATSFDEVSEGALELARQGLSVEESLSRVEVALKLVRVAGIDSQAAVAGLTAAIKGFEASGITVAEIGDKLSEVDTKFAVSTEDLINGLERAGASARVAGVSFDELLSIITVVEERTKRGGAVIGNAFKTIFARLGRTDTLAALENLGIQVLDAQGNVRSALPLIQDLASELDGLGLKSAEAGEIIQKVAGVRQRDILISLIEDLNSGQSQFARAVGISADAVGALDTKNAKLNDTLEALINKVGVASQEFASLLGEIGFADAAKDLLGTIAITIEKITDFLDGDSIGGKFAKGLIKGIGGVLTGPGLALVTAIFVKLFVDLAKFGLSSLKSLLGINKAAQAQAALQQSVLQTLFQNENIQREILALEGNKVAQEQLLLKIYNQQAAALARVQKAAATVTPGLFGRGFRGGEQGINRRGASGYVAAEARDVSRGVGGAPASSKVVSIPNFAFGGGKRGTMVANTSEYYVPNYSGGGDAIFNRDMVRSSGLPSGARKINAAGGYIPNFVRPSISISKNPNVNTVDEARRAGYSDSQISQAFGAQGTRTKSRAAAKAKQQAGGFRFESGGIIGVLSAFARGGTSIANTTVAKLSPAERTKLKPLVGLGPKDKLKPDTPVSVTGIQNQSLQNIDKNRVSNFRKDIDTTFAPALIQFARTLIGGVGIQNDEMAEFVRKVGSSSGNLFSTSVEGGIFESAIQLGTKKLGEIQSFLRVGGDERSPFDFEEGGPASRNLVEAFRFGNQLQKADAKRSSTPDAVASLIGKSLRDGIAGQFARTGAGGYIPNYAGGALDDAIGRERAAGVPINQIRINQSGKLRNAGNPDGLAVTNTRDEPTGRIPNFALTVGSTASRIDTKTQISGAALQSFAKNLDRTGTQVQKAGNEVSKFGSGNRDAFGTVFALQAVVSGLSAGLGGMEGEAAQTAQTIVGFANALTTAAFAATAIPGPAGLVIGGLTGLALVSNEVFKIFNDGKGILSLFTEQLSEGTKAQIEYNKSLAEASAEGGVEAFLKQFQRNLRLETIRTEGTAPEAAISAVDIIRQRGLSASGDLANLTGVGTRTVRSASTPGPDTLERQELPFFSLQNIVRSVVETTSAAVLAQPGGKKGGGISTDTSSFVTETFAKNLPEDVQAEFLEYLSRITFDAKEELKKAGLDPQKNSDISDNLTNVQQSAISVAIENIRLAFQDGELDQTDLSFVKKQLQETLNQAGTNFSDAIKKALEVPDDGVARITGKEFGKRSRRARRIGGLKSQGFGLTSGRVSLLDFIDPGDGSTIEGSGIPGPERSSLALGGEPGLKTQLLEKELALSTEISTVNKNRLQDEIEGINLQISASSQRFKLADDLTQKLIDQTTIEEESATKITERLQAGEGLNEIMQSLTAAEKESLSTNSELVEDFLEQAEVLEVILAFEQRRVANAKAIRDAQVSRSFTDGLNDGMKSLQNQTDAFNYKLGTEAPMRLANGLGSAMSQALSGAESVSDALNEAGKNFLQYMIDAVMQQAAMLMMQRAMGFFGFGIYTGGPVKNFANGGGVSGSDTVPAMLAPGEFVMSKSAVDSVGQPYMQSLNAGQAPMGQTATAGSNTNNNVTLSFNITQGEGNSNENPKRKEGEFNGDTGFVRKIRKSVVQIISEESRPGGALYGGS